MGALARLRLFAHDVDPRRMADLPPRAARAGLAVTVLANPAGSAPYDLVLVDAPCTGSGTWRRTPDAKWRLTPQRLEELCALQDQILSEAAPLVVPGAHLAFATCSVLREECEDRLASFQARLPGWELVDLYRVAPRPTGDGFFQAVLRRPD
jgi:16S rRNA (cytosine967-C5)-methyltransferase